MDALGEPESANNGRTTISVDAMGGDRGAASVVAGVALAARKNPEIRFILHGPRAQLEKLVARRKVLAGRVEVCHAQEAITMKDNPRSAMRNSRGSSMWSALESVRNKKADVCVSCGNTGALMLLSVSLLRTLPNINRPAIAVLWPSLGRQGYNIVLDVGADIRATAQDLLQYALMGAAYARNGMQIGQPRVGLLNVGTEDHKGRSELRAAHALIKRNSRVIGADFKFAGFVEGSDLPGDKADVIVTDGFTGNVALKTAEGTAQLINTLLRQAFRFSPLSRLAAILAYTSLRRLRRRIDPRYLNGGVFLGLDGIVVKSHGGADAKGVAAALRLAFRLSHTNFNEELAARVAAAEGLPRNTPEEACENDATP
ncbi:MAG: phosphate acyltransferase PlsX [Rhodobacteraceae bacterium]|nr:phosphate acyltransferase PlsX [Paracoccaceae bacterium]